METENAVIEKKEISPQPEMILEIGYTEEKEPTIEVQTIADAIKPQLESKYGKTFSMYKVIRFRQQLIHNINYLLKIQVGEGKHDFIHVHVSQALPFDGGKLTLRNSLDNKLILDYLEPKEHMEEVTQNGYFEEEEPSADIQYIAERVKKELETKFNKSYQTYKVVKLRQQLIHGHNYLMKIKVGDGDHDYIHAEVMQDGEKASILAAEDNKGLEDRMNPKEQIDIVLEGSYTEEKEPNQEAQKIAESLKSKLSEKLGKECGNCKLVKSREAIGDKGTNYLLKIQCGQGDSDFVHVKAFHQFDSEGGDVILKAVRGRKTEHDYLDPREHLEILEETIKSP